MVDKFEVALAVEANSEAYAIYKPALEAVKKIIDNCIKEANVFFTENKWYPYEENSRFAWMNGLRYNYFSYVYTETNRVSFGVKNFSYEEELEVELNYDELADITKYLVAEYALYLEKVTKDEAEAKKLRKQELEAELKALED